MHVQLQHADCRCNSDSNDFEMSARNILRRRILDVCRSLAIEIRDHLIPKKRTGKSNNAVAKKPKRLWVRSNILERQMLGTSNLLRKDLSLDNSDSFLSQLRMPPALFEDLLRKVSPLIGKRDTTMRQALSSRLKLQIALRFLALGYTYRKLEDIYSVPRSSISHFIKEVLDAMPEVLEDYRLVQAPQNHKYWKKIQEDFMVKWQFPFCCGALDGKHVYIKNPPQGASEYFKYQGTFSIVMLALVDANYKFIYIDVGKDGRMNDASVFNSSSFNDILTNNTFNLPDESLFVANDTFPLRMNIMTPFISQHLNEKQEIFNHHLTRCQRVAENALGIMISRFKVFEKPQNLALDKVDSIIRTCAVLHNWLSTSSPDYIEEGLVDEEDEITGNFIPGSWRSNPNNTGMANIEYPTSDDIHTREAVMHREKLADYLLGGGAKIK